MAEYIFSVASIKYGTPTGTNSMPGTLESLPDTVKGTVTIEESEGSTVKFYVDQKKEPIRQIKTEEGELTLTAQFYDLDFAKLAVFKGGTNVTGATEKFVPSTGYTTVEKALEITFDSGHVLNMFNASCVARVTGGGGRDKMISWELRATPQLAADLAGSYEWTD